MAVTVDRVKAYVPAQADRGDGLIAELLLQAPRAVKLTAFDEEDRDTIVLLWVAHRLTVTDGNAAAATGSLTASSVGGVSEQYAAPMGGVQSEYDRTAYGQELRGWFRTLTIGGLVSG